MRKRKPPSLDTSNELLRKFFCFEIPVAERRAVEASIVATRAGACKSTELLKTGNNQQFKHHIEKGVLVLAKYGEPEGFNSSVSLVDPQAHQARK